MPASLNSRTERLSTFLWTRIQRVSGGPRIKDIQGRVGEWEKK